MQIKANIQTPIGTLTAIADDYFLCKLLFIEQSPVKIEFGQNQIILKLKQELNDYFNGKLRKFTIPIKQNGSEFETLVWNSLQKIPFGETINYKQQSQMIGKIKSFRAVANANGRNQIMIIIPCHRVIKSDCSFGGYIGGIDKKKFLIEHEKSINVIYKN